VRIEIQTIRGSGADLGHRRAGIGSLSLPPNSGFADRIRKKIDRCPFASRAAGGVRIAASAQGRNPAHCGHDYGYKTSA